MAEPRYQQKTPIVDQRYTPSAQLLQFVEGSAWTVNYYSQLVGSESELSSQQVDLAPAYQQYCLIKEFELKVTQSLSPVQDPTTRAFEVTGAATTYSRMIPNVGDVFAADAGDGRIALFTVISAEKKSYHKDAVYQIEYKLKNYFNDTIKEDLAAKTVKTTIFRKEFLQYGQNPQVLAEDFDYHETFKDQFNDLIVLYLLNFFSRAKQTLLIPDQEAVAYDPFLTAAFMDLFTAADHPLVARIVQPRVSGFEAYRSETFWNCLLRMDADLLPVVVQKVKMLDGTWFRNHPTISTIYYSGIQKVIYPLDELTDADTDAGLALDVPDAAHSLKPGTHRFSDLQRLLDQPADGLSYAAQPNQLPDIVAVTDDDYYVFSENFYRPALPHKSNLERLVKDFMAQKAIDKPLLKRLADNAKTWRNLERFYYTPILLAMLRVAIRTN